MAKNAKNTFHFKRGTNATTCGKETSLSLSFSSSLFLSFFLYHQNFKRFMIVSYVEVGFFKNKMTNIEKNIWIKTQTTKENNNGY